MARPRLLAQRLLVALALSPSLGCGSFAFYRPQPSPRISTVGSAYAKDGRLHDRSQLPELVRGNAAAELEAAAARKNDKVADGLLIAGTILEAGGVAAVIAGDAVPSQPAKGAGAISILTGVTLALISWGFATSAGSHAQNAVNIYNDGLSPETPTPTPAARPAASGARSPVAVPFERGNTEFAPGDEIVVTQVTGDRAVLETGGTYHVEGTWRLGSRAEAQVMLWSTNGEIEASNNRLHVQQGNGRFNFDVTVVSDGALHVSFYPPPPGGNSFGGTYFGTPSNVNRGSRVPGRDP